MSSIKAMPGGADHDIRAFTMRLPSAEHEALRTLAFLRGTSVSELLLQAVRTLLAEQARSEDLDAMVERTSTRFRETIDAFGGQAEA